GGTPGARARPGPAAPSDPPLFAQVWKSVPSEPGPTPPIAYAANDARPARAIAHAITSARRLAAETDWNRGMAVSPKRGFACLIGTDAERLSANGLGREPIRLLPGPPRVGGRRRGGAPARHARGIPSGADRALPARARR